MAENGPQDMESWLRQESLEYKSLRRGDVVEGTVMGFDRDGVLVDIGSKSEGVIPPGEMHSLGPAGASRLQKGDQVIVYVLQPETPEGQVILSLDRARGERGWRVLQQRFETGECFEAEVINYNRGGLLVNVEGVHGFVPLSQVVGARPDRGDERGESSLAAMVGRRLQLKVIEINRRRNRVILSERAALQELRTQQKDRLLAELHEGDIRRGRITSIRPFGVFVDLGGADGLVHLSELSWDRNKAPQEMYKVGDEVDVYVMKVDPETKKIALSLRRAQPRQWNEIVDHYQVGQVVVGQITKLVAFGAFARIAGPIEGLIHVSELVDRRIGHPKEVVREGDILPLQIVRIERERHRLGLSLKAAREEGEALGFVFNDAGQVIAVPEEYRQQFTSESAALLAEETDAEVPLADSTEEFLPHQASADEVVPLPEGPQANSTPVRIEVTEVPLEEEEKVAPVSVTGEVVASDEAAPSD